MTVERMLFFFFAAVLMAASGLVISRRNPVHSALFLVLAFFTSAAIWMLLEAEFLAITLILVYVGAVMVLFLFVVMMLDIDITALRAGFVKSLPVGLIVAIIMAAEMISIFVSKENFAVNMEQIKIQQLIPYNNTAELGNLLYTDYVYPFEIAAVILLVAIVAAIGLTMRRRPETKYQDPSKQVAVRRQDRLRLVKMEPEQRAGDNE